MTKTKFIKILLLVIALGCSYLLGYITSKNKNPLTGIYKNDQYTTIEILEDRLGNLVILGDTLWGVDRKYGPNIGGFSASVTQKDSSQTVFTAVDGECEVKIFNKDNKNLHLEDNYKCGGMNARFLGEVRKENRFKIF